MITSIMTAFKISQNLLHQSLSLLRKDKELLVYTLALGFFVSIVFTLFLYISVVFFLFSNDYPNKTLYFFIIVFVYYILTYFVVTFFNACLISMVYLRLNDRNPSLRDGFSSAVKHIGPIFFWSLLSATIGVLLRLIEKQSNSLANAIAGVVGLTWGVFTFFVVPVMILEDKGPVDALKRSGELFKKTWGENVLGQISMTIYFLPLLAIAAVPLFIGYQFLHTDTKLTVTFYSIILFYLAIIYIFIASISRIFETALYYYAATGKTTSYYNEELLKHAYMRK